MKKPENWDSIPDPTIDPVIQKPEAGGYVFKIVGCVTKTINDAEELRVTLDIAEGEFTDYYYKLLSKTGDDEYPLVKLSKRNMSRFKAFISSVTLSNENFKWDWDESKLLFKFVGGNLAYGEYKSYYSEEVYELPYIVFFCKTASIYNGKIKPVSLKRLSEGEKK